MGLKRYQERWKKKKEEGERARNGSWDFGALAFYTHSGLRLVPEILRLLWTIPVTMGGQGGRDKHRDFSIYNFTETSRIGTLVLVNKKLGLNLDCPDCHLKYNIYTFTKRWSRAL